jgi:hypothetical protein
MWRVWKEIRALAVDRKGHTTIGLWSNGQTERLRLAVQNMNKSIVASGCTTKYLDLECAMRKDPRVQSAFYQFQLEGSQTVQPPQRGTNDFELYSEVSPLNCQVDSLPSQGTNTE